MNSPTLLGSFTLFHVVLSLIGIFAGFFVIAAMLRSDRSPGWTATFLWSTLATTVTGFLFPFKGVTPAFATGIVSLAILAPTFFALFSRRLHGGWRVVYTLGAVTAFYLNFFVLIVQSFLHIPALHALAPTQQEPPFAIAQGVALVMFVVFGIAATRRFRPLAN